MRKVHIILSSWGISSSILSETLSNKLNLVPIKINNLYRELINSNAEIAVEVKSYLDKGQLIPDDLISRFIETRISSINSDFQIISYPRNKEQFLSLETLLNANGFEIEHIWFLKLNNVQQMINYKLENEGDNPYIIKFELNKEAIVKNYHKDLNEFEELKKALHDKNIISVIELDYPIEKHKIENLIRDYIAKKSLNH